MANAATPLESLRGFISKIEDFHRLMNFLEVPYLCFKTTIEAAEKLLAFSHLIILKWILGWEMDILI